MCAFIWKLFQINITREDKFARIHRHIYSSLELLSAACSIEIERKTYDPAAVDGKTHRRAILGKRMCDCRRDQKFHPILEFIWLHFHEVFEKRKRREAGRCHAGFVSNSSDFVTFGFRKQSFFNERQIDLLCSQPPSTTSQSSGFGRAIKLINRSTK